MVNAFDGCRVLVTGAASGIGRASCDAFRAAGARAFGLDRLASPDGSADWAIVDLAQEAEIVAAVAMVATALGGFDVLVNCAGIELDDPIKSLDIERFDRMVAVNLRAPLLVTREALKAMRPGARIVNIASELAYLGRAGAAGYCATKAGILSLTRSLARELAPDIVVNAVAPGPIDTPLLNFDRLTPAQQAAEIANPMGRIGRVDEVARAVLFLASPANTFITGQCLSVDGGAAMH